ncbi:DUF4328 domain-containing protein [Laceyella putida]|uniref:DUF4328 domain-containing protein n=1 Tax=Laceyella putida TaxID=110101 RepID=A0ABW2RHR2_9BACL
MQEQQTNPLSYRSPSGLGTATVILLSIYLAFSILLLIGDVIKWGEHIGMTGLTLTDSEWLRAQSFTKIANLMGGVTLLPTSIVFLMWVYRIHKNLPALGVGHARMSPGWAVGWFFVPFAKLVMPYLGMKDAWYASSQRISKLGGVLLKNWWAFWLLFQFDSRKIRQILHASEHLG